MSRVGIPEVQALARLARIRLSDEEASALATDLSRLLEYFERLQKVKTDQIPPCSQVIPSPGRFREDQVEPSLAPTEAVGQAPEREQDFVKVPQIIEGEH